MDSHVRQGEEAAFTFGFESWRALKDTLGPLYV
jgi:hypothetical protein